MVVKPYPGDEATSAQLLALAHEYRKAAWALVELGRRGAPLSRAPFRSTAIHAIELYLSAFLMARGHTPGQVRKLHHDVWARSELALGAGLDLRKRTAEHLRSLNAGREYLASRYGPERAATLSHVNRLTATLDDVATKVTKVIAPTSVKAVRGGDRLISR